jgi:acetyl-CoA synthetase
MADERAAFRAARDFLLAHRDDYATAFRDFSWPDLEHFNWAFDWFDMVAAEQPDRAALRLVGADGSDITMTYADMALRSGQVAAWLRSEGVDRGDRILLLLGNTVELWEVMLAAVRLGAVIIPATTLLGPDDVADRIERGHVSHVVTASTQAARLDDLKGNWTHIAVGPPVPGWLRYDASYELMESFEPEVPTRADELLLLYFTSGTTAQPKLVAHTHASYPVGHLSTMYWLGLRPDDVHLNVSSPGWAKHAWSSFFAPWNAGATILVVDYARFEAATLLDVMQQTGVTTICAPPTVWRMFVQEDLSRWSLALRDAVGAGEPLNPEVIEHVRRAWGITIRDGYGQTETTAQVGNSPGQEVRLGSMGRPLPGYPVVLVDPASGEVGDEGEICLPLHPAPMGLTPGYLDDPDVQSQATRGGHYHTGDVARRDADGYITYVGRADDVFKASDYRISPFELESALIEHPAVAEAAVVPSPDPVRLAVPKAYVVLAKGWSPDRDTALDIMRYARAHLAPYKRIRRIEFAELPKTISGKIRRVELRAGETERHPDGGGARGATEFWEEDLPELSDPSG